MPAHLDRGTGWWGPVGAYKVVCRALPHTLGGLERARRPPRGVALGGWGGTCVPTRGRPEATMGPMLPMGVSEKIAVRATCFVHKGSKKG